MSDASASTLRRELNAPELVWISVQRSEGRLLLAVRRFIESGVAVRFGAATQDALMERVVALLSEALDPTLPLTTTTSAAAPPAIAPAVGAPALAPAVGPPPRQPVVEAPIAAPAVTAPRTSAEVPAPSASATDAPATDASATDAPATGASAADASVAVSAAVVSAAPPEAPGIAAGARGEEIAAADADTTGQAAEVTSDVTPAARPEPGTTERLRVAIVAFAGIELYGYGVGARLEIPLVSLLAGIDDSLSLGVDLGLAYAQVGIDGQGHAYEAFQIPAAAYLTWRFAVDDVEIGPRLGGVVVPSIGQYIGPRLSGDRVSFVGMVLVGVTGGFRVAPGVQLFAGLDLALGPRVSGIISAGVAL